MRGGGTDGDGGGGFGRGAGGGGLGGSGGHGVMSADGPPNMKCRPVLLSGAHPDTPNATLSRTSKLPVSLK
jgi:hypothetical protein